MLKSFGQSINVVIIGAGGGIGRAIVELLQEDPAVSQIYACSRSPMGSVSERTIWLEMDLLDEDTIATCAKVAGFRAAVDMVIVTTGILHDKDQLQPEKSWRELNAVSLQRVFEINTFGPALVAKHFLPILSKNRKAVFAALSARVGSISDNRRGGWAAYRASKAALNMMIRTLAIELKRRAPEACCVALHPGTVDTALSLPFQANVPTGQLFTPAFSAHALLKVIDNLKAEDTGGFFAWDGTPIEF